MKFPRTTSQRFYDIRRSFVFLAIALLSSCLIIACQGDSASRSDRVQSLFFCCLMSHAWVHVCVSLAPEAVITLEEITFADAIALGISPIGTATYEDVSIDYLKDAYSSPPISVGKSEQANLETILSLKPDLIAGIVFSGEAVFKQLSQIAPTALGSWVGYSSWREYFDFVAQTLGRENEAAVVWDDYAQHISDLKTALSKQVKDKKLTMIYSYGNGMTIDAENSFIGSIFADLDLSQPDYPPTEDGTITLSEELMPTIDADILFVSQYNNAESEATWTEWQKKPLWQQLKAVKAGQVYTVDADIWRGGNPIAAEQVLDELFEYLVKESA